MFVALMDLIRQLRAQHRASVPAPDTDLYQNAHSAIEYGRTASARADRATRRIEAGDGFSADWSRGIGWDGPGRRRDDREGPP